MTSVHRSRWLLVPGASTLALLAACSFILDRREDVAPGEVVGIARKGDDDAKAPAALAGVTTLGTAYTTRADGAGRFRVRGLPAGTVALQFQQDESGGPSGGDGWPERTATRSLAVSKDAQGDLVSVFLGNVDLNGPMQLSGTATQDGGPVALGLVARVVLQRGVCADGGAGGVDIDPACAPDASATFERTVEAEASVDGDGFYFFQAVQAGRARVAGLLYEKNSDGSLGALVSVFGPLDVSGAAGDVVTAGAIDFDTAVPVAERDVQIHMSPSADGGIALYSIPGTPLPPCGSDEPLPDGATQFDASFEGDSVVVTMPVGIWDVRICSGDRVGQSFQQLVSPSDNDDPLQWFIPLLDDPCADDDCNGNGFDHLPLPLQEHQQQWAACFEQCGTGVGTASVANGNHCTVDGDAYDCDDDDDGQPDATEPLCVGAGLGTDLDGDGLCFPRDSFPRCSANQAALCPDFVNEINLHFGPLVDTWLAGPELERGDLGAEPQAAVLLNGNLSADSLVVWNGGVAGTPFALMEPFDGGVPTTLRETPYVLDGNDQSPFIARAGMACAPPTQARATDVVCYGGVDVGDGSGVLHNDLVTVSVRDNEEDGIDELHLQRDPTGDVAPVAYASLSRDADDNLILAGGVGGVADNFAVSGSVYFGSTFAFANNQGLSISQLVQPRALHVAASTLGLTYFIGGQDSADAAGALASVEVYDAFEQVMDDNLASDMHVARVGHSVTRLLDGRLLVVGGLGEDDSASTAEILDPTDGACPNAWRFVGGACGDAQPAARLRVPRSQHSASLLADGRVLITGGVAADDGRALADTEIFDPLRETAGFQRAASMYLGRARMGVAQAPDSSVVVVGGTPAATDTESSEVFPAPRAVFGASSAVAQQTATACDAGAISNGGRYLVVRCRVINGAAPGAPNLLLVDRTGLEPTVTPITAARDTNTFFGVADDDGAPVLMTADASYVGFLTAQPLEAAIDVVAGSVDFYVWERATDTFSMANYATDSSNYIPLAEPYVIAMASAATGAFPFTAFASDDLDGPQVFLDNTGTLSNHNPSQRTGGAQTGPLVQIAVASLFTQGDFEPILAYQFAGDVVRGQRPFGQVFTSFGDVDDGPFALSPNGEAIALWSNDDVAGSKIIGGNPSDAATFDVGPSCSTPPCHQPMFMADADLMGPSIRIGFVDAGVAHLTVTRIQLQQGDSFPDGFTDVVIASGVSAIQLSDDGGLGTVVSRNGLDGSEDGDDDRVWIFSANAAAPAGTTP